ncbi:MAG: hypothetical protein RBT34_10090 [Anaerolineaceae bacterium]|jgi:hypothetical protein|nr:hypothetical protein [Anaerolineaceae bacterium]
MTLPPNKKFMAQAKKPREKLSGKNMDLICSSKSERGKPDFAVSTQAADTTNEQNPLQEVQASLNTQNKKDGKPVCMKNQFFTNPFITTICDFKTHQV